MNLYKVTVLNIFVYLTSVCGTRKREVNQEGVDTLEREGDHVVEEVGGARLIVENEVEEERNSTCGWFTDTLHDTLKYVIEGFYALLSPIIFPLFCPIIYPFIYPIVYPGIYSAINGCIPYLCSLSDSVILYLKNVTSSIKQ